MKLDLYPLQPSAQHYSNQMSFYFRPNLPGVKLDPAESELLRACRSKNGLQSKLLVSPSTTPIVLPHIILSYTIDCSSNGRVPKLEILN